MSLLDLLDLWNLNFKIPLLDLPDLWNLSFTNILLDLGSGVELRS